MADSSKAEAQSAASPQPVASGDAGASDASNTAQIDPSIQLPEGASAAQQNQFGWFGGVFTPTLLTILGVIMFVREGWVIGHAGLLGGLLIITVGFGITLCTALAMSAITTNIRIGAGGAYAIIAQSLGLEVGGSVGIPRFLSQALAVTMYLFGFREGWLYIFPEHPTLLVDAATFLTVFVIAYVSADFAIRVQYLIMAVIACALASIGMAAATGSMQYSLGEVQLWGDFAGSADTGGSGFWVVFAVFFPATTGIMAGANMSGDLKDPKRAIPLGTLLAIGVSFVIYVVLAIWLARSATPEEMTSNYTIMMDKAYWPSAVLAGLLGATFSSALASLVGAARILQAMGAHRVVPGADWLEQLSENGEPRNAMWITGGIIFLSLLVRDLNAVAPLITMFFLVTYAMICASVLIEQSLDLVSFRPRLQIPRWVSFLGLIGSLFAMFIINPTVSLVAVVVTLGFYVVLARRHLDAPFEDVRSGMFVAFAEWAAKRVTELPTMQERAWKPNLLVPVENANDLRGSFLLIENITKPQGSVKILGVAPEGHPDVMDTEIETLTHSFRERGVFASSTVLDVGDFAGSVCAAMQALRSAFFRPNTVFLRLPESNTREDEQQVIIREAEREEIAVMIYAPHPRAALGQREVINVWIHDRSPDWRIAMQTGNLDLALLAAYKLSQNWDAKLRLITIVDDPDELEKARDFLAKLIDLGRIPNATLIAEHGEFKDYVQQAPHADLNIFGLLPNPNFAFFRELVSTTESSCVFVRDSGRESAIA
ncbi:Na-K-Cl cotransporter [Longimonas halophila]|uniref:Na-K-Cl cotransporter n=1 Tax=Longimonas halophila TaxID=1469170 RepID=A0A2H3P2B9_9BACT|nr:amino acid permease [Longimonas halophila]PEN08312.1 Na-K-Cl cotransporter [Longimonas halophila]